MKTLILTLIATLSTLAMADTSIYADAFRFADQNHTGVIGIQGDHIAAEVSVSDGSFSVSTRKYLEFTNIEIGSIIELTNSVMDGAKDYRVIDIEGGLHLVTAPYIKVGSEWFALLKLDETNSPVLSVGFKLF